MTRPRRYYNNLLSTVTRTGPALGCGGVVIAQRVIDGLPPAAGRGGQLKRQIVVSSDDDDLYAFLGRKNCLGKKRA